MTKPDLSIFKKQVRYKFGSQTDFVLQSMTCVNVRTADNLLWFLPSVTDQTHILLTHALYLCKIIMKQLYLISCMTEAMCAYQIFKKL